METKNIKVIWCGAVLSHRGLEKYSGETPAATQWTRGLLSGLNLIDVDVTVMAPVWDSLYPKGCLFPGEIESLDSKFSQVIIRYLNFPCLRSFSVALALQFAIRKELERVSGVVYLLNYNPYSHYCWAASYIVRLFPRVKWVNVVLDLDDPTKDDWKVFKRSTGRAYSHVFLSWWGAKNAPVEKKLHLDGGWDGELPSRSFDHSPKILIYAGKMSSFGGINEVIDAIKVSQHSDVEYHFFGKDRHDELTSLSKIDLRVKIHGFVTDEILDSYCRKAYAFFCPREMEFQGTKMIFPSKILFYLKYRKPLIGHFVPGLSPEYRSVLITPEGILPIHWIKAIDKVLNMSSTELEYFECEATKLLAAKTWAFQALRLKNFLIES